ncbi:uncharacterized protein METZ01_LOCUS329708, partial [marine metagenome]
KSNYPPIIIEEIMSLACDLPF